jgi:hypothetical protein
MASGPEFDPGRLLHVLAEHEVDFVVVGGIAAVLYGSARQTYDLDVTYSFAPENLRRLGAALVSLGAKLRGVDEEVPFVPDAPTLRGTTILTLTTPDGDIDLLLAPSGAPGYAELRANARALDIGGVRVRVAAIDDLIAMKKAAGRPKDLADLAEFEAIKRLTG